MVRNLKVNINESIRIKGKMEKIVKRRRKIKRGENCDIEKLMKERIGGEVEMMKVKRKRNIVVSMVKGKVRMVYKVV